jgi:hypothetical protein
MILSSLFKDDTEPDRAAVLRAMKALAGKLKPELAKLPEYEAIVEVAEEKERDVVEVAAEVLAMRTLARTFAARHGLEAVDEFDRKHKSGVIAITYVGSILTGEPATTRAGRRDVTYTPMVARDEKPVARQYLGTMLKPLVRGKWTYVVNAQNGGQTTTSYVDTILIVDDGIAKLRKLILAAICRIQGRR